MLSARALATGAAPAEKWVSDPSTGIGRSNDQDACTDDHKQWARSPA
jgi:hypothetical protein